MKLLFQYLQLCAFKNNPAELIPSKHFIRYIIIFYFLSGWLVEGLIADPVEGLLEVVLRMIMAFSTISIFLLIIKKWSFFTPLFTAIFVCENFIMTLATAVEGFEVYMVMNRFQHREEILISLATFLVVWYLTIVAYILRQLFTFNTQASFILATSYFVLTYGIPMMFMDM